MPLRLPHDPRNISVISLTFVVSLLAFALFLYRQPSAVNQVYELYWLRLRYNDLRDDPRGGHMKRLYRSRKNRMLGGVCGGIAEYFGIDPVIVRLIAVALFFVGGSAVLAYIIALIVIPYEPWEAPAGKEAAPPATNLSTTTPSAAPQESSSEAVPLFLGIVLIIIGAVFLMHNIPYFSPFYYWARHYVRDFFWPSILIVFGVFLIARGWKK
jgi:phage shock protein C